LHSPQLVTRTHLRPRPPLIHPSYIQPHLSDSVALRESLFSSSITFCYTKRGLISVPQYGTSPETFHGPRGLRAAGRLGRGRCCRRWTRPGKSAASLFATGIQRLLPPGSVDAMGMVSRTRRNPQYISQSRI
jgi:hypothetical protein